jgi:hypothetical protein
MYKKMRIGSVAAAVTVAALAAAPASAPAAHCTAPAGAEPTPGFSWFGMEHVQGAAHDREGGNPGPHMGTSGASNCRETSGSPSGWAPGQS